MAQPTNPRVTERRLRWRRAKLYFMVGCLATMLAGSFAFVAVRAVKKRRAEVEAYSAAQAATWTQLEGQEAHRRAESDAVAEQLTKYFHAASEVRRIEAARPVDRKALRAATARRLEAMKAFGVSPSGK